MRGSAASKTWAQDSLCADHTQEARLAGVQGARAEREEVRLLKQNRQGPGSGPHRLWVGLGI